MLLTSGAGGGRQRPDYSFGAIGSEFGRQVL